MSRPAVLQDLGRRLRARFEAVLFEDVSGEAAPADGFVQLMHPADLDEAETLPAVALYLYGVELDAARHGRRAVVDAPPREVSAGSPPRASLRSAPFWLTCRYVLAVRGRDAEEEHGLVAAAYRGLYEEPSLRRAGLPSLRGETMLDGVADVFALSPLPGHDDLWRQLGLARHRLLVPFEITVPIPGSSQRPAVRVLERRIDFDWGGATTGPSSPAGLAGDTGGPASEAGRPT